MSRNYKIRDNEKAYFITPMVQASRLFLKHKSVSLKDSFEQNINFDL